jgi:hypothetical protein
LEVVVQNRGWIVDLIIAVVVAAVGAGIGVWGTILVTREERKENAVKQDELNKKQAKIGFWMNHLSDGEYEWQWAGEGWLGNIVVVTSSKGEKSVTIDVDKYCPGNTNPIGKVLESRGVGVGKVEENVGDQGMIRLTIPVMSYDYDAQCHPLKKYRKTLYISLYAREAYDGTVFYKDQTGSKSKGGIALLNSHARPGALQ